MLPPTLPLSKETHRIWTIPTSGLGWGWGGVRTPGPPPPSAAHVLKSVGQKHQENRMEFGIAAGNQ